MSSELDIFFSTATARCFNFFLNILSNVKLIKYLEKSVLTSVNNDLRSASTIFLTCYNKMRIAQKLITD